MTRDIRQNVSEGKPRRCTECGKKSLVPAVITHKSEIKYEGILYTVEVADLPVLKCTECGEVVFGVDADDKIYSALRKQLGLYQPEEIQSNRKALGLTQRQLADQLGVASETVSRWECGLLIQSRAMNNLLKLYFDLPEVRRTLGGPDRGVRAIVLYANPTEPRWHVRIHVEATNDFERWLSGNSEVSRVVESVVSSYYFAFERKIGPLGGIFSSWERIVSRALDEFRQMEFVKIRPQNTASYKHLRRLERLSEWLVEMPTGQRDVVVRSILPLSQLTEDRTLAHRIPSHQ